MAVDVDSADTYRVTAQLRDSGETVIATGGMAGVLATGVQTVTLTFDGLTIFDNGVDGPYEIAQLALVEDGDPDLLMVDYMPVSLYDSAVSVDRFSTSGHLSDGHFGR